MKIINTKIEGLKIVKHRSFHDKRGFLRLTHDQKIINKKFVFEYCTTSYGNSLRGFHFQSKFQQAKYVTVLKGKILDYVIDLRKNSKTFGNSFKIILSKKNKTSLYIPEGFAHAYFSFNDENIIYYKLTNFYHPEYENGINLFDKTLNLKWPKGNKLISKKDKKLMSFSDFKSKYKHL